MAWGLQGRTGVPGTEGLGVAWAGNLWVWGHSSVDSCTEISWESSSVKDSNLVRDSVVKARSSRPSEPGGASSSERDIKWGVKDVSLPSSYYYMFSGEPKTLCLCPGGEAH